MDPILDISLYVIGCCQMFVRHNNLATGFRRVLSRDTLYATQLMAIEPRWFLRANQISIRIICIHEMNIDLLPTRRSAHVNRLTSVQTESVTLGGSAHFGLSSETIFPHFTFPFAKLFNCRLILSPDTAGQRQMSV